MYRTHAGRPLDGLYPVAIRHLLLGRLSVGDWSLGRGGGRVRPVAATLMYGLLFNKTKIDNL